MSIARLMQQAAAGVPTGGGVVWTDPDLANASYDSVSFSVAAEDGVPLGMFFKPDGAKVYILGGAGDEVNEYDLSVAWDISTASFNQVFDASAQGIGPNGLFFSSDGTKMYIPEGINRVVNEYNLSTAWDVSTATYSQNFSISSQDTAPQELFFKPDGTKMYLVGGAGDDVNEYSLSTAWDISTASYVQNFSVSAQEANPHCIFFNPDGTKMYIAGSSGDDVNEYNLSSGWDISTASYVQNFSVASQETSPRGLFFKSDGSKMYIVGVTNDTIYQYSTD